VSLGGLAVREGERCDATRVGASMDRPVVRVLRGVDCAATIEAMRSFTEVRSNATPDEIWLCEHPPLYTQGLAGKPEHVLDARGIAVLQTNRGGQVTYHGPGQVVAYPLIDLRRLGIYVKEYVYRLEHCVIKTLAALEVTGHRVAGAPGIYVRLADPFGHAALTGPHAAPFDGLGKIAAIGIKVSRHCTYHGVALNVAMDLAPFDHINPCGYAGLQTIDLATLGVNIDWAAAARDLGANLAAHLSP
jgi:lipoyl(octanoyl) transferase